MVNSVVKGVSKLTLCKGPGPPSSAPVDVDELIQDDGSHTAETESTSRSGNDVLSPSQICQGPSVRESCAAAQAPIAAAAKRYSETLKRWSEEQHQQFASGPALTSFRQDSDDDESGILYQSDEDEKMRGVDVDAFMDDDTEELTSAFFSYRRHDNGHKCVAKTPTCGPMAA